MNVEEMMAKWERAIAPFLKDIPLSDMDNITSFPGYGYVVEYLDTDEKDQFIAYIKKLVAKGVPQVTPKSVYEYVADLENPAYPIWYVQGVPSKRGRQAAAEWMKKRGIEWDGKAPALIAEVTRALIAGEEVPRFGLLVRRFLFIKERSLTQTSDTH